MKLIKPSVEILAMTMWPLELIEKAGRTCYKSENKIIPKSEIDFANMILKRGHESVIEHASATVRFICDRGVTHEIVRHRLASYSQESTRYCDYDKGDVTFIIPPWTKFSAGEAFCCDDYDALCTMLESKDTDTLWLLAMQQAENSYKQLRNLGWRPEQARSVLPNSLKTEIVMTANFREWKHFFKLRTAKAAHPQMREVAIPLLKMFKKEVPVIFDDIECTP